MEQLKRAACRKGDLPMTDTQRKQTPCPPPGLRDRNEDRQHNPCGVWLFQGGGRTDTAADKMMKVLEAEAAAGY